MAEELKKNQSPPECGAAGPCGRGEDHPVGGDAL